MDKEKVLNIFGAVLIFVWIAAIFEEFPYFGSLNLFWFCKISFLLLGLACLTKNSKYLFAFFAIGIIPNILWIIDFFSIISGHTFIGSTSFMFEHGENKLKFVMNLLHLFLLPTGLFIAKQINIKKSGKWLILVAGYLVIIISYFVSGLNVDMNCVHNLCYPVPLNLGIFSIFIIFAYIATCAFIIEPIMRKTISKINDKLSEKIVWTLVLIAIAGAILGILTYNSSPHYQCISNKVVKCERFFTDRVGRLPYLQFSIQDNSKLPCELKWFINGKDFAQMTIDNPDRIKHLTLYFPNFDSGNREITSKLSCSK